ncbi:hypothetical protein GUJ93_ZPchr0013g36413 [Zizania palustris]|uniref:Uncharacterized protein n=1 Tax=Zizania palustris TaxID=103762 RepID=A0A8J5X0F8_ZIZPA|nr:hypothetical protein GUJ93_ZPchr0013g36413 [Zizania palustris]
MTVSSIINLQSILICAASNCFDLQFLIAATASSLLLRAIFSPARHRFLRVQQPAVHRRERGPHATSSYSFHARHAGSRLSRKCSVCPVISISGGPHDALSFATAVRQQNTAAAPFCVFNLRQQQHLMHVQRLQLSQDFSTGGRHEQQDFALFFTARLPRRRTAGDD